jgi:circadian clock protein KaiB
VRTGEGEDYRLLLFVSGATPRSLRAVAAVRKLCEKSLAGRYTLDVIDAFRDPVAARDHQIVVLPTLLRLSPSPRLLLVGDMSETAPLAAGLGLPPGTASP